MRFDGFDRDEGNLAKCCKHGVSIEEIEDVLCGNPAVRPDPEHSEREIRIRAIGKSQTGRWIFLAFTFRERDNRRLIRPVSARYMHAKEILHYERAEATARFEK